MLLYLLTISDFISVPAFFLWLRIGLFIGFVLNYLVIKKSSDCPWIDFEWEFYDFQSLDLSILFQ